VRKRDLLGAIAVLIEVDVADLQTVAVLVLSVCDDLRRAWVRTGSVVVAVDIRCMGLRLRPTSARACGGPALGLGTGVSLLSAGCRIPVTVAVCIPPAGAVFIDLPITVIVNGHSVASIERSGLNRGVGVDAVSSGCARTARSKALRGESIAVTIDECGDTPSQW